MAKTTQQKALKRRGLKAAGLYRVRVLTASCQGVRGKGVARRRPARVKVGRKFFMKSMKRAVLRHAVTMEVGESGLSVKKGVSDPDHESRKKKKDKQRNGGKPVCQHGISGMEEWEKLQIPVPVIQALKEMGFVTPTEIQCRTIPPAITEGCDVIGAAETGSGKTLAFTIPILHHILHHCKQEVKPCLSEGQRHRKNRGVGPRIIDLNRVIRSNEDEESEDEDGGGDDSDTMLDAGNEGGGDSSHEQSIDDGFHNSVQSSKVATLGLVAYRDDIPEKEFEAMLSGNDIITGSHDPSSDVIAKSHDPSSDVITKSHDPSSDVITKSHDPSSDVITKSHDPRAHGTHGDVATSYSGKFIALILAPTRELALQVHSHIKAAAKYTGIKACALVGGMAMEKQERLLGRKPPIVVATPGRLWKLMSEGDAHLCSLDYLRFLVLDEADRMVEFGHFQELGMILDRVNGSSGAVQRQTLVFSATLTLPRRSTERKRRKRKSMTRQESIDNLISRVGLRESAKVIDLTTTQGTVHSLTETKIMCTAPEKDLYLYYFLLVYPGRTLVFVNSIDCLQRVRSLLELLELKPLPLHAHMQQRQRIKNLERFVSNPKGLLLASDVAARGLDIPQVQHVIHYQVPRNSELYVHRSGRTARAHAEGLSVILVGPEDLKAYHNICRTLNRDEDLANFPVDLSYFRAIRERVGVAREIDSAQHKQRKTKKSNDWFIQSAKAMDMELDEDLLVEEASDNKKESSRVQTLKAKLNRLLGTTLIPRSISSVFPTRGENHKIITGIQESSQQGQHKRIIVAEETDALTVAKQNRF